MQNYQLDPSSGTRLIGGDMLMWSDVHPEGANGIGNLGVITGLIGRFAVGRHTRVLLLGPRAGRLVAALDPDLDVEVVVRSLPDARELASEAQLRRSMILWCGGVERFEPTGPFDLVVVLDGPDRLLTPDSPGSSDLDLLRFVSGWVADSGTLIAQVGNGLGLASVLDLPLHDLRPEDDDREQDADHTAHEVRDRLRAERAVGDNSNDRWWHGADGFADRRPYRAELEAAIAGSSLALGGLYGVYPEPDHPALLVRSDNPHHGLARTQATRLQADLSSTRAALMDPQALVPEIFDAGLQLDLAPGWLLVAGREAAPSVPMPTLVWGDLLMDPQWRSAVEVDGAGAVAARRGEMLDGRLRRDFERFQVPPVTGVSLEAQLRNALASADLTRIRRDVRRYVEWLLGAEISDGQRVFATPENVVAGADGCLRLLDDSWEWLGALAPRTVATRNLRHFARRVLRARVRHPWRAEIAPDELTETLVVMGGLEPDPRDLRRAAEWEVELRRLLGTAGPDRDAELTDEISSGASQFTATGGPARGYRETVQQLTRMSNSLEVRQGQIDWLEAALRMRERRLEEAERTLGRVRESVSFRIGRSLTAPGRRVLRSSQRASLRLVPPEMLGKLENFVRRNVQ